MEQSIVESWFNRVIRIALFCVLSLFLGTITASANDIPPENAIRAILGEARGEGFEGMYAVACAIRNRGTLRGVYGATAETESIEPELWQRASKAWYDSEDGQDITLGADHWHNVDREGENYWTRKFTKTVKIGHHQFYRDGSTRAHSVGVR